MIQDGQILAASVTLSQYKHQAHSQAVDPQTALCVSCTDVWTSEAAGLIAVSHRCKHQASSA